MLPACASDAGPAEMTAEEYRRALDLAEHTINCLTCDGSGGIATGGTFGRRRRLCTDCHGTGQQPATQAEFERDKFADFTSLLSQAARAIEGLPAYERWHSAVSCIAQQASDVYRRGL